MKWNQNYAKFYKSPVTPSRCIPEADKKFIAHYDYNYVMDKIEVRSLFMGNREPWPEAPSRSSAAAELHSTI